MNLYQASEQWAHRPDDERFWTLEEMRDALQVVRDRAAETTPDARQLHAVADGGEVKLVNGTGHPAALTHWAFGQTCSLVKAPAAFLRELPVDLAANVLENRLRAREWARDEDPKLKVLLHRVNGGPEYLLRAMTGTGYGRFWDVDLTANLFLLREDGWQVPPARPANGNSTRTRPATAADVLQGAAWSLSIREGDLIGPAGLYGSDHDCFVFMVDQSRPIDAGTGKPVYRGFFCWNSETGGKSFGLCAFLYSTVCGNHIVWDVKECQELRIRHTTLGSKRAAYALRVDLKRFSERAGSADESRIQQAKAYVLGKTKDEVLDRLFKLRIPALTKSVAQQAYTETERNWPLDGDPGSAWGIAQGITRVSQKRTYADDRVDLDRAAGKVLQVAW